MPRPARLLCIGKDPDLLRTRCAVLSQSGYDAQAVMLEEAESLLRTSEFDLVIVSAGLSAWERGSILLAAGKTSTLVLTELTLADDLLAQVERLLSLATQQGECPPRLE
jgi:DNA-binding response OmpR family regulator